VLHGDVHHFNILRADQTRPGEQATWLAIDPKGLAGDRCFDLGQFLLNPSSDLSSPDDKSLDQILRRLDIFSDELGLDRQRAQDWAALHSVLQSCWSHEEGREGWRRHVARAEALLGR